MSRLLPLGKLPPELLNRLLTQAPVTGPGVVLGPGPGLDCAVVEPPAAERLLVVKSDPITFASQEIGWYAVQINANDLATSGATPRWFMLTMLLPEGRSDPELVEDIFHQVCQACQQLGVTLLGGHTEITSGLERPILAGTLLGEVARQELVTPRGARQGDVLLLTKGVPIEATALLAREFPERLGSLFTAEELAQAQRFLYDPGISVLREARLACAAGEVTAMHDPTEGGLAGALWELAEASGRALWFEAAAVPVPPLSARLCAAFGLDPLAAIASGALLLTAPPASAHAIRRALESDGIACAAIGRVAAGPPAVWLEAEGGSAPALLPRPRRDAVAAVFERNSL
jgi:hydrogenase expression/formation protein HypE